MPLKIIDSSTIPLNLTNHSWAFRKTRAGVKSYLKLVAPLYVWVRLIEVEDNPIVARKNFRIIAIFLESIMVGGI